MSSGTEEDPTLSPEEMRAHLPAGHPTRIGSYRLVRVLGEGGMGTVYEAGTADVGGGSGAQPFFAMELIRGATLVDYANGRSARASASP